jgi:TPP-dependent 2-oxoacid decarboxylase
MAQATVGAYLFEVLYDQGIRHAFGIPGDFALPTFRWLESSRIKLLTMTHEPSVGFAADGYARVHGMGLACVTYCVGGLNMLNSIACAYAEKSPVVVVSGGPSPLDRKHDPLLHHKVRTFDTQRKIYDEVTCASAVLIDPRTAADEILRVVMAVRAQCRPGYIEVPFDVVDLPIAPASARATATAKSDAENLEAAVAEAAEAIGNAKKPAIVADIELHRHGLTDLALEIAQKFNIPIAATLLSKSIISETNPLYIGVYSGGLSEPVCQEYVESSDCLILLGAFLTDVFMGMKTAKLDRRRTILANTEKLHIGLHAYENVLLKDFLEGLKRQAIGPKSFVNPYQRQHLQALTDAERAKPVDSENFFRILGLELAEDATVCCDVGDAMIGAIGLRTSQRGDFLADAYYLSMGFAIPAAIGAMAARPHNRVYAIVGDGAFQMTGMELSTCAKYGLHPIVCILNNDGYGTQRQIIDGPFNDIHRWDYTAVCGVLKYGKSVRVTTCGELEAALRSAASANEMTIIEVVIPRDDCSRPLRRMASALGEMRDVQKRHC